MALIFCPECGTQISEHAQFCVKCAYPITNIKNRKPDYTSLNTLNPNKKQNEESGLIIAGYIVSVLSLFILPIFLLITGVIIGIINISRGSLGHGMIQIILSIIFGTIGSLIGIVSYFLF